MSYNFKKLNNTFKYLANSSCEGVQGVVKFEGATTGPVVGITLCTHGNEPSGLAVANFLLNHLSRSSLLCGTLYLVLNNIEATQKYFSANTENDKKLARYVDVNMNRLPKDTLKQKNASSYEVKRAQDLYHIWKRFTVGLDIHSTSLPSNPMIISRGKKFELIAKLLPGFPINVIVSNIEQAQHNLAAFMLYGGIDSNIPVFAIETGQHTNIETFNLAVRCSVALLQNLGMLPGAVIPSINIYDYHEYVIEESIMFPDSSFDFIKNFKSYDAISKGELLAKNTNGDEIKAPFNGHLIFPTEKRGQNKDVSEEVAFLSRPMTIRHLNAK